MLIGLAWSLCDHFYNNHQELASPGGLRYPTVTSIMSIPNVQRQQVGIIRQTLHFPDV